MRYLKFLIPLVAVVAIDVLFQLGIWEPIASPDSHAGASVSKKLALADPAYQHIDFVTLGNSRAIYGIDHSRLAQTAALDNYTYVDLSLAGSHWMSVGAIGDWLSRHHPEIRGGIIALSVQDFVSPGDNYELAIAYPFRSFGDLSLMAQHITFDWHNPATYGLYSGLFEYHEDVQDLLEHPQRRRKVMRYFRAFTPQHVLTGNADENSDMCSAPVRQLSDCSSMERIGRDARIPPQCKQLEGTATTRFDMRPFLGGQQPLNERLQKTRDLIRARLQSLNWQTPPIVVLMPIESVWLNEALPAGAHEWTLSVLEPLVAEKKIRVLDYTDMFNTDSSSECSAFFDLYHNNVAGREKVMEHLMPEVEQNLFQSADRRAAATVSRHSAAHQP